MTIIDLAALSDAELLPCPFCGGSKLAVTSGPCSWNDGGIAWNVTCHTRDCHGGIFALGIDMFSSPEKAIAAWNTRHVAIRAQAMDDLIAANADMIDYVPVADSDGLRERVIADMKAVIKPYLQHTLTADLAAAVIAALTAELARAKEDGAHAVENALWPSLGGPT